MTGLPWKERVDIAYGHDTHVASVEEDGGWIRYEIHGRDCLSALLTLDARDAERMGSLLLRAARIARGFEPEA